MSSKAAIPFEYECENGHSIGSDKALTTCPWWKCYKAGASLKRVGRGSRTKGEGSA